MTIGTDPFALRLGVEWVDETTAALALRDELLAAPGRLRGPVGFALVDYTMCSAVAARLAPGQSLATMSIAVTFVANAASGMLTCRSTIDHIDAESASLRSEAWCGERTVLTAVGRFAIIAADGANGYIRKTP